MSVLGVILIIKTNCLSKDLGLLSNFIVSYTVFSKLVSLVLKTVFYFEILGNTPAFQFPHLESMVEFLHFV